MSERSLLCEECGKRAPALTEYSNPSGKGTYSWSGSATARVCDNCLEAADLRIIADNLIEESYKREVEIHG